MNIEFELTRDTITAGKWDHGVDNAISLGLGSVTGLRYLAKLGSVGVVLLRPFGDAPEDAKEYVIRNDSAYNHLASGAYLRSGWFTAKEV